MLPQLIGRQIALKTPVQHGACAELLKLQKVVTSETLGPGSERKRREEKERKGEKARDKRNVFSL